VDHILSDTEVRVLGALIEKEITTPDYYPLSLNALTAACNQTSNRNPVTHFDEDTVTGALESLRDKKLVHLLDRGESRVLKYRHVLYEAMNWGRPVIAVMCVLMLRGPQTVGEIRTRTNRLYDFSSLQEVELTLSNLMSGERPLVARLARQTGQKEVRYAHLLAGEVSEAVAGGSFTEQVEREESHVDLDRISRLEQEVEDLKRQFEQFKKQFE
jgi:uncharacterized protein YceH (UPF0502 family)